ncbi:HTH-type transcriptional repressor YtrA [compost metagenome]
MIIRIDMESEMPIYTQLVHQIIEGIVNGQLLPYETLPSVRRMASDIGINMHTVNKAYKILEQEGYIQIHRRKGVVVLAGRVHNDSEQYLEQVKETLRPVIAGAIYRNITLDQLQAAILDVYEDIHQ